MARIRSIHPDQWTDDRFVSLTSYARLLAIGVRNVADDNGIFVWNPIQLKIRLFPVDHVDIESLLDEISEKGLVYRYRVGEMEYGLIRNFWKYQRPKAPSFLHPPPPEPEKLPKGFELNPADSRILSSILSPPVFLEKDRVGRGRGREGGVGEGKGKGKTGPISPPDHWLTDWNHNLPDELWNWCVDEKLCNGHGDPGDWMRTETAKMLDWAKAKGIRRKDWPATWRNWMRRAAERGQESRH